MGYGVKDGFTGCLFYTQDGFAGQDSQTENNLLRFKVYGMSLKGWKEAKNLSPYSKRKKWNDHK